MAIRKSHVYLSLANSYLIDSPQPSSINYWWNLGSLLGLCLVIQIATGIFLAMHVRRCASFVILIKARYYFVHIIKSLTLGISGNRLLNLAWWEKVYFSLKQVRASISDEISNLWLKLHYLKINFRQDQAGSLCLACNGTSFICDDVGVHDIVRTTDKLYISNTNIKGMSDQPKDIDVLNKRRTAVFTKGSNTYVKGGTDKSVLIRYNNVNTLWNTRPSIRKSVPAIISIRLYSTGSGENLKVLERLNDLSNYSKDNPSKHIDRKLFNNFILNKDLYLFAYDKLRSKPGMMTPGINPTTLDGISHEIIDKLIDDLKDGTFKFTPAKRIFIDKASGGQRPLSLGNPLDKLVQEVIRLVLEAIYEPTFYDISHGFRPNKSTHTALRYVFTQFRGCTWWIEGDIEKCFDTIPHDKLLNLLRSKIKDDRFIALISKSLKAGYMLTREVKYDIIGTPQGSIISPILANIYLHQLDEYILSLKSEFDSNIKSRSGYNRNRDYRKTEYELSRGKKRGADKNILRSISSRLRNTPTRIKSEVDNKIVYVRYADDWIVAVNGSYRQALEIKSKITKYCQEVLNINISENKTKITNSYKNHILFLGTNIKHAVRNDIIKRSGHLTRSPKFLMLTAPMSKIAKKLSQAGLHTNHIGKTKTIWLPLELSQIIYLANSIIYGYLNYYSFVYNRSRLTGYVYYIVKDSVLRTIAAKMRLKTRGQVINRYGKNINIDIYKDDKVIKKVSLTNVTSEYKMNVWNFKQSSSNILSLFASSISMASILGSNCSVCGSEYRVEMHHVRKLKDLKLDKSDLNYLMSKRRRKQIALCRNCHMKHHNGTLTIPKAIMDKFTKR